MYQFTTTTVINSSLDSNGTTAKFAGATGAFTVSRVGKFLTDKITAVYKRPYTAGVKAIAAITVPTLTANKVARLEIDIRLSQDVKAEYASSAVDFQYPLYVEVIATGTAGTDAAALVAQINALKNRFGYSYVTATVNSADITITAVDNYQRFNSIKLYEETAVTTIEAVQYVAKATGTVSVTGAVGFGDDEWMIRSISVPTIDNTRFTTVNKEERPIIGGNYTQYTLQYNTNKDHEVGILAGARSITTHVFYVLSSLVTAFEVALANAGIVIDTVNVAVTAVTVTSGNLDLSVYATDGYTITYTTTPSRVTGAVWSRNTAADVDAANSDADFTKVTVSPSGVITLAASNGLAANDVIGLTVSIDGYTVNKTLTVQA